MVSLIKMNEDLIIQYYYEIVVILYNLFYCLDFVNYMFRLFFFKGQDFIGVLFFCIILFRLFLFQIYFIENNYICVI